jgi:uncharacterized membrane protein
MTSDLDEALPATPAVLRRAADRLRLDERAFRRAAELARVEPDRAAWICGIERFLLVLGITCLLAGIASFFAFNWDGMHRLGKLALIECLIVAAVAATAWRGIDSAVGRATLFAAACLVGTLFAVYGQAYQTGADPYGLFVVWAVLIAGWVVIGRTAALWLLLLVLVNLALILWWTQVLRPGAIGSLGGLFGPLLAIGGALTDGGLATLVFLLDAGALLAWEFAASRSGDWLQARWWPRVVALLALVVVVNGTIFWIFGLEFSDRDDWLVVSGPLGFIGFATASLWFYRVRRTDLFIVTATLVAGIVVVTTMLSRMLLPQGDVGVFLLLAVLVVLQTSAAAFWVRRLAAREHPR